MSKRSAGLLPFQQSESGIRVFLVHPGGPFWAKKDEGAWSIPKGEYDEGEDPLTAARREFTEETGVVIAGDFISLGEVRQAGGKVVNAWAIAADFDASQVKSNTFTMEWPPKSGKVREFPEVDRGEWFTLSDARTALNKGQVPFLSRLALKLGCAT